MLILITLAGFALGFDNQRPASYPLMGDPQVRLYLPVVRKNTIDLTIAKVKVIQGETLSDGYQVYVANRPAVVRVFVGSKEGIKVDNVSGRLCAYDISGSRLGCLTPDNGTIQAPSIEGNLARTLNFTIPLPWIIPGTTYYVDIDPDHSIPGEYSDNNRFPPQGRQLFNFVEADPLQVKILPIIYQPYPGSQTYTPETNNLDYLTSLPIKIFPVPSNTFQLHSPVSYLSSRDIQNLTEPTGWVNLLNLTTSIHNMEDPAGVFHYYGLVNSYDAHGCANGCITGVANLGGLGGEKSAVGWSGLGMGTPEASITLAHELGHNFGRRHVLCQGNETDIDKKYPYPGGSIGQFGLDVNAYTLYPPAQYADIMSYCPNLWISDYTYWNIFQFRQTTASLSEEAFLTGDAIYIRGIISPDGAIELFPVYRQDVEKATMPRGSYRVELLNQSGQVLGTYAFDAIEVADAPGFKHFGFFVPYAEGFSGLRIRQGERVLSEKIVTGELERTPGGEKEFTWRVSDKGTSLTWPGYIHQDEAVVYRIRYSNDGGKSWQVLALDWQARQYDLPFDQGTFPRMGFVEIQASDGIHTQTEVYPIPEGP